MGSQIIYSSFKLFYLKKFNIRSHIVSKKDHTKLSSHKQTLEEISNKYNWATIIDFPTKTYFVTKKVKALYSTEFRTRFKM